MKLPSRNEIESTTRNGNMMRQMKSDQEAVGQDLLDQQVAGAFDDHLDYLCGRAAEGHEVGVGDDGDDDEDEERDRAGEAELLVAESLKLMR